MPQEKEEEFTGKRKPGESIDAFLKRVSAYIEKNKTTDWDKVGKFADKFVKDVRSDKGKESDEAILKEVSPGRKYTPKKRKKRT